METTNKSEIVVNFDGEDEGLFHTEEEVSDNFNIVQNAWIQYDNCEVKLPYEDAIRILKKVEASIIRHGMFSPNESVKEIPTENLKYLLLPFYLADIFSKIQDNRKSNLALAKNYYDEFIKLCNHYELVTKEQRRMWKTAFDDMNYEPSREDKIGNFKDKKELENQIKNLEKIKDEDTQREILTLNIKTKIIKTLEEIRFNHLEMQMQDHKEKLERERQQNPQGNGQQDKREAQPKKMKVWHIPKPTMPDQSYLMSNKAGGHGFAHGGHGCHACDPNYNLRAEMAAKVFQPGTSMPTVRLEEFADGVMKMNAEMEKQQNIANEIKAKEDAKDQDMDEIVDAQTLKDRAWDDWKDANEKGAGNKNKNR